MTALIARVWSESRTRRQILLHATINARTKVQFNVKTFLAAWIFGRILVQHNDNLRHVIQFGDHTDVFHRAPPLFIFHHLRINKKFKNKTEDYFFLL